MPRPTKKFPLRNLSTYGQSHAVRLPDFDYSGDADIHLTICAEEGAPFRDDGLAAIVCENVEFYSRKLGYRLYGFTLMPDHLHVLFSPADSGRPLKDWLRDFKSFTTNRFQKQTGKRRLWQESGHDHVCRTAETAEKVLI
ncbi:MAG: transposase [Phycisphaerae bacterium]|nr:transposase [Phycisphaerae bacterium]